MKAKLLGALCGAIIVTAYWQARQSYELDALPVVVERHVADPRDAGIFRDWQSAHDSRLPEKFVFFVAVCLIAAIGMLVRLSSKGLPDPPKQRPSSEETTKAAGVAAARESARIQFERDIGLAEANLKGVIASLTAENEYANGVLTDTVLSANGGISRDVLDARVASIATAKQIVLEKSAYLDWLHAEAARLGIPIAKRADPDPAGAVFEVSEKAKARLRLRSADNELSFDRLMLDSAQKHSVRYAKEFADMPALRAQVQNEIVSASSKLAESQARRDSLAAEASKLGVLISPPEAVIKEPETASVTSEPSPQQPDLMRRMGFSEKEISRKPDR
jgi:hypothetical protein